MAQNKIGEIGVEDIPLELENIDVAAAVSEIDSKYPDFDWSVDRGGEYAQVRMDVLEDGGTELEANVISGAEKVLDILDSRGIDPGERKVFRNTDFDGVIHALEDEDHQGFYPGIAEAKTTYPVNDTEMGEAIITGRGIDYTRNILEVLGWHNHTAMAPENGNIVNYDNGTYIRDVNGYVEEEFSPLTSEPMGNFHQLLRRLAAKDNLKLIFGKSKSPARTTVSVEEVEKTGLRGDGFYAENFDFDPDEFRHKLEMAADHFGYDEPSIDVIESVEDYEAPAWFDLKNPVATDGERFVYADNDNANNLLDHVLTDRLPYLELRYDTVEGRDDLIVIEHDTDSKHIDRETAESYVEKASYLNEMTRGRGVETEVHEDSWIDAYIPVARNSRQPVKELAAREIAGLNAAVNDLDDALIFHMDDRSTGVPASENTVAFVKYGHPAHQYAEENEIDHVESIAFPDYYLTVSEALGRAED